MTLLVPFMLYLFTVLILNRHTLEQKVMPKNHYKQATDGGVTVLDGFVTIYCYQGTEKNNHLFRCHLS